MKAQLAFGAVTVAAGAWRISSLLCKQAVTPRVYLTRLTAGAVTEAFSSAVAVRGWEHQMSRTRAVSAPLCGHRRSITVAISARTDGHNHVWIGPDRLSQETRWPNRSWAIRWRLGRFERRLRHLDPDLIVTKPTGSTDRTF